MVENKETLKNRHVPMGCTHLGLHDCFKNSESMESEVDEFAHTVAALKVLQHCEPMSLSVRTIKLPAGQWYSGPAGSTVKVAFNCLACVKQFKTIGAGGRLWYGEQKAGVASVRKHVKGTGHARKHSAWMQCNATLTGHKERSYLRLLTYG